MIRRLLDTVWRWQFARYLLVGGWNTVFGYGLFAGLYYVYGDRIHYLVISIASTVIAITVAYVGYKFFVFKTRGNYVREYLRFYVVYGVTFVLSLVLLPCFIEGLKLNAYLAQALVLAVCILFSFLGHKKISFRTGSCSRAVERKAENGD